VAVVDDKITASAWREYLAQTRNLIGWRYERAEPFAWAQLQARLGKLKVKRRAA
jgi:hypothetical protein